MSLEFYLTYYPIGVGKTTLIRKICAKLNDNFKLQGFFTDEVRSNGQRIGFDMITTAGTRCILARERPTDSVRRPKVGKYSVYVEDFEQLALSLLKIDANTASKLLVVDEIGRMELSSKRFAAVIDVLLQQQYPLLATIPSQSRQPIALVERLRSACNARVYHVTKANRDSLLNDVVGEIIKLLSDDMCFQNDVNKVVDKINLKN